MTEDHGSDRPDQTKLATHLLRSYTAITCAAIAAGIIAVIALSPTLSTTWIFDDDFVIKSKERIVNYGQPGHSIWDVIKHSDRPLTDAWFAVQLDQLPDRENPDPRPFKIINLIVHGFAALCIAFLCSILAMGPRSPAWMARHAAWFGLGIGALWGVHPLTVQGVAYTVQRAESLASLFAVACAIVTLLALRSKSVHSRVFLCMLAFAFMACSIWSKPVAVGLVALTVLADRASRSTSWRETLRGWWAHCSVLFGAVFALTMTGIGKRVFETSVSENVDRDVGFASNSHSPIEYLATQGDVIPLYLWRIVWPETLVLDYRWIEPVTLTLSELIWPGPIVLAMLVLWIWAIFKRPWIALALSVWFVMLAPTSSIIPIRDMAFEHRVYLAMLGPLALIASSVMKTAVTTRSIGLRYALVTFSVLGTTAFGVRAFDRAQDYRDPLQLWEDQLQTKWDNTRVRRNLANGYMLKRDELENEERIRALESALVHATHVSDAFPKNAEYLLQTGDVYYAMGRDLEALEYFRAANQIRVTIVSLMSEAQAQKRLNRFGQAAELYLRAATLGTGSGQEVMRSRAAYESASSLSQTALQVEGPDRVAFYRDVVSRFELSLRYDPDYESAQRELDSLRSYLLRTYPTVFSDR